MKSKKRRPIQKHQDDIKHEIHEIHRLVFRILAGFRNVHWLFDKVTDLDEWEEAERQGAIEAADDAVRAKARAKRLKGQR
jgi:hypothetical protein